MAVNEHAELPRKAIEGSFLSCSLNRTVEPSLVIVSETSAIAAVASGGSSLDAHSHTIRTPFREGAHINEGQLCVFH